MSAEMIVLEVEVGEESRVLPAVEALLALGARDVELEGASVLALFDREPSLERVRALGTVRLRPYETFDHGSTWARSGSGLVRIGGLSIDARGAFGSGLHATTAMCLERIVARSPCPSLLDAGTGTGILALNALLLGARRVVAIDNDPLAVEAARANASRNGLELIVGDALPREQFDTVVANILASPLLAIAPELVRCLAARAVGRAALLVLSGIRTAELERVARVYRDLGLRRIADEERDGWCCLELEPSW